MDSTDIVVVIGGSSGLGLAVARRCLADGASVVIAGRSAERLEAARAGLAGAAGCAPSRLTSGTAARWLPCSGRRGASSVTWS